MLVRLERGLQGLQLQWAVVENKEERALLASSETQLASVRVDREPEPLGKLELARDLTTPHEHRDSRGRER